MHLFLDKHAGEQLELIDLIGERVQTLGGVVIAVGVASALRNPRRHVAKVTIIERPPNGVEEVGSIQHSRRFANGLRIFEL